MADVFKKIKGLFIVDESTDETTDNQEETTEEAVVETPTEKPTPTQTVTYTQTYNATSNISSSMVGSGAVDSAILDSLIAALAEANQPGFDFFEFKNAVKSMESIPMDDATKYRTVFATAATMGVTVDALLQSSEYYKAILQKEKENFDHELLNQVELNVKSKERELEALNQDILHKSELIQQLTKEIQLKQEQSTEVKKSLIETMDKIEMTKKNFVASFDTIFKQVEDDTQKINMYLKS